jgi:hypothetical protein
MGVPVSSNLLRQLKPSSVFQRILQHHDKEWINPKTNQRGINESWCNLIKFERNVAHYQNQILMAHARASDEDKQAQKDILSAINRETITRYLVLLLIACASSRIMYCQVMRLKYLSSCTTCPEANQKNL